MPNVSLAQCQASNIEERKEVYAFLASDPKLGAQILHLMQGDDHGHEVGSWFLKHHLECNGTMTRKEVASVYRAAGHIEQWQALVRRGLRQDNKFVRAWAYNGFHQLALIDANYKLEVTRLLNAALRTEAPSVKARIHNILKSLERSTREEGNDNESNVVPRGNVRP